VVREPTLFITLHPGVAIPLAGSTNARIGGLVMRRSRTESAPRTTPPPPESSSSRLTEPR
jgi:hypothetical protein